MQEDIAGNADGVAVTAAELNTIIGVSGAIDGTDYSTALAAAKDAIPSGYADPANPTPAEIQTVIDSVNATNAVVEDIAGNSDGIAVTSAELNTITGVSGAIDGIDYSTALAAAKDATPSGYADPANPTPAEIQAVIDSVNATNAVIEDIAGNADGVAVTAAELNQIVGVDGAIDGIDYTAALINGTYLDRENPTAEEIQIAIADSDGDEIPNAYDLDDDNDGIADLVEQAGNPTLDTDGDGIIDSLDLDSDNDGISDNVEAQTTAGYIAPIGTVDTNGVDTIYIGGLTPIDTDSDGIPDYIDTDTDGDGLLDKDESGLTLTGVDADNDGIDDGLNASYSDVNGDINNPSNDLREDDGTSSDVDYRSFAAPVLTDTHTTPVSTGTPVVVSVLSGNFLGDGSTPAPTDVNITLIDPATGSLTQAPVVVEGEGTWSVDSATGEITFTPIAGFTGDPTPLSYEVTDLDNGTTAQASITVDYPADPVTVESNTTNVTPNATGTPAVISVLDNLKLGDGSTPAPTDVNITLIDPATGTPTQDPVVVEGEGRWSVDSATGEITFTPIAGFTGDPTPLSYEVTDLDNGTTAQADVNIDYPDVGIITGSVNSRNSNGNLSPIANVTLVLFDIHGNEIARTITDADGNYNFSALPGNYYIQEAQPNGYYDVSENEGGSDNESVNSLPNTINVTITLGEVDVNNDFVESLTPIITPPKPTPTPTPTPGESRYVSKITDYTADIHWEDEYDEIAYEIYVNGEYIETLGEDVVEYKLTNLSSNTKYEVKIIAHDGYGGAGNVQTLVFTTTDGLGWLPAIYNILLN